MSAAAFEARLRGILEARYHDRHPFNQRMMEGALGPDEIRRWVRNRYYYQTRIPIKDGLILTKADDPAFRRGWIRRIHDHDGTQEREGGLELWLRLAEAVGCDREEVASLRNVLPGVRRACDDYVALVESHDLLSSVASSLTEICAGPYLGRRADAFRKHYGWIADDGLAYFRSRTVQAPRDAAFGLRFVLEYAADRAAQERCAAALERKCEILWGLLDAVEAAHARLRPASHVSLREEGDGCGLAVLPERAVRLDRNALQILSLCDGKRSASELAAELRARHPEVEGLEDDVHDFLGEMERLGVLERAGS